MVGAARAAGVSVEPVGEEGGSAGITATDPGPTRAVVALLEAAHPEEPAAGEGRPAVSGPPSEVGLELPSARLARLARDAAAAVAQLPMVDGSGVDLLPPATLAELTRVVDASLAEASKRAYRADWDRFTSWAADHGYPALPAPPAVLAAYVTAAAAELNPNGTFRYRPASLTRWVSSINQAHTAANLEAPGRSELVRRALSGIRRIRRIPPQRVAPLLLQDVRGLVDWLGVVAGGWPAGVAARRDAALLLMGFAGAFRRSELVGLTVGDVSLHRVDGLHVRLRSSKTDQEAAGRVVALPYGRDPVTCPPCAWTRWRELLHAHDTIPDEKRRAAVMRVLRRQAAHDAVLGPAATDGGQDGTEQDGEGRLHVCRTGRLPVPADPDRPLFPSVHGTGLIRDRAMTGHAVLATIRRRAEQAGHTTTDIAKLGGHSLRAGFVTEAFRAGADAHAIMRQTGHRNPAMLEVYAREYSPLTGNAVTRIGL